MPFLSDPSSSPPIKLLLLGDSGSGKTGALLSLVKAGYSLRIADFDNGTAILGSMLANPKSPDFDPAAARRVNFQLWTDDWRTAGSSLVPVSAKAWTGFVKSLDNWPDSLGPVHSWGPRDILVVDSLNFAGKAAMRFIQQLENRLASPPRIQDYRDGQLLVEGLCARLYAESIRCNVICITHIRELGKTEDVVDDKGRVRTVTLPDTVKGFPETGTGRALSTSIGRYFNDVLMVDIMGQGQATRRVIRTVPHQNIGLKNSAPGLVKPSYDIKIGLAEYFAAVRPPQGEVSQPKKEPVK